MNNEQFFKLLIVDDSYLVRRVVETSLADLPIQIVATAGDGKTAIDCFQKLEPDLVSLDLTMPEMDGLTALEAMMRLRPKAKIVIVSALNDKPAIVRALNAGAAAYVVKPFSEAKLADTFRKVIEGVTRESV